MKSSSDSVAQRILAGELDDQIQDINLAILQRNSQLRRKRARDLPDPRG